MRRFPKIIAFLLLLTLAPTMCFAATPSKIAKPKPAGKVLGIEVGPMADGGVERLTQVRWANHTDAATGDSMFRIVFDVTGSVTLQSNVTTTPTPKLNVIVKGTTPGSIDTSVDFDGKIADGMTISTEGQDTKIAIDLPLAVSDGGYRAYILPPDAANNKPYRVVIDINKPIPVTKYSFTAGLKNKLIAIDAGHGGSDAGAVGPNRVLEKSVNLAVALKVKALLESAGARVIMTRTGDNDVYGPWASDVNELKARTTVANARKADLFLSIHSNSFRTSDVGGSATYYYQKTNYDALLARSIQDSIDDACNLQDRGAIPANFYVIKRTVMPAALVEMAFISNYNEEKLLNDPAFQQKMAQGIVTGLDRFFAQVGKGGDR